jgi:hypothetical protein
MSESNILYFRGVAKWAKVDKPDDTYHNYSINLDLDEESLNTFDASGIRVKPKLDEEDGRTYVRFRRSAEYGPPAVVDDVGAPFKKVIGNGSIVTAAVEVYQTKKMGKGHRLMAVRVDKWVEFKLDPEMIAKREAAKVQNIAFPPAFAS